MREDDEGKAFYNRMKKPLRALLDEHELSFAWNLGSGTALHVRPGGIVPGFFQKVARGEGRETHEIGLRFQEASPGEEHMIVMRFLWLLRMQERIFAALRDGLPEAEDPILLETRLPRFRRLVDELWAKFAQTYPDIAAKYRRGSP